MRSLYDIQCDLEETNDGEETVYGIKAVFGERLEQLIQDIKDVREVLKSHDGAIASVRVERDTALKELNQIKEQLAEAFKGGGEVKTSQGKRSTYPGQIVLFCSAGGPHSPAMVMEVCGFPVGKVGLRVFSKSGTQDKFLFALYREEGEMRVYRDTWRFID